MAAKKKEEAVVVEEVKEEVVEEPQASSALTANISGENVAMDNEDFMDGLEGGEMTLSQIPTLKLTQSMTPEVTSRDYPDVYAGMYINDLTKEVVGDTITFRLIYMWRSRVKFPPRDQGGTQVMCSCPTARADGNEYGSEFGLCRNCNYNNFMPEHCQTQYTLVVALNDNPYELYRLILARTSFKAGTEFAKALRAQQSRFAKDGKLPMFMFKAVLQAKEAKNSKLNATYYVSDLQVLPCKDVPEMDETLKEDFMRTLQEVGEMRNKQIASANARAQERMAEKQDENATSKEFNAINSNIASELGFGDEEASPSVNSEDTPF